MTRCLVTRGMARFAALRVTTGVRITGEDCHILSTSRAAIILQLHDIRR
jgi:hypothetical protein